MKIISRKLLLLIALTLALPGTGWAMLDMSSLDKRIKVYFKYVRGTATQEDREAPKISIEKDLKTIGILVLAGIGIVLIPIMIHDWIKKHNQQDQAAPVLPGEKYGTLVHMMPAPNGNIQIFAGAEKDQPKVTFVATPGPNYLVSKRTVDALKHAVSTYAKDNAMAADLVVKNNTGEETYSLQNGIWTMQNAAN